MLATSCWHQSLAVGSLFPLLLLLTTIQATSFALNNFLLLTIPWCAAQEKTRFSQYAAFAKLVFHTMPAGCTFTQSQLGVLLCVTDNNMVLPVVLPVVSFPTLYEAVSCCARCPSADLQS